MIIQLLTLFIWINLVISILILIYNVYNSIKWNRIWFKDFKEIREIRENLERELEYYKFLNNMKIKKK